MEARDDTAFSSVLAKEGKLPWQVSLVLNAVKIFRQLFPEESAPDSEIAGIPNPILQMTDCLRKRHYSRSTEKTCLGWCRRYLDTKAALMKINGFFQENNHTMMTGC